MSKKIRIVEVGARDGLQNEKVSLSPAVRTSFIKKMVDAGINNIELGAFVSPKWVPQMAGSSKIAKNLMLAQKNGSISKSVKFSALVPNLRGMEEALESGVKEVAVFGAVSESFSQMNINCSVKESLKRFEQVVEIAHKHRVKVRGYVSTVFGCPFEGKVSESKVVSMTNSLLNLGVYEVSLGDTIGVAHPKQVVSIVNKLLKKTTADKIAMHFHDTRGTGLSNVLASLQCGITSFDSSLGGLGGCPYAPAATGNIATEDLLYMLHSMGYRTGIDLDRVIKINKWMSTKVKRQLPSKVGAAGLPKTVPIKKRK